MGMLQESSHLCYSVFGVKQGHISQPCLSRRKGGSPDNKGTDISAVGHTSAWGCGQGEGPAGSCWWDQGAGKATASCSSLSGCEKRILSYMGRPPNPSCRQQVLLGGGGSALADAVPTPPAHQSWKPPDFCTYTSPGL